MYISPSKYTAPKLETPKNPLLNRPSTYKTPGGLYLEIALKYKVKLTKQNGSVQKKSCSIAQG